MFTDTLRDMTNIKAILHNITVALDSKINETTVIGLNGKAGIILYYFYYYKFSKEEKFADKAIGLLQETIGGIDASVSVNLYDGISGIGWLLEHLNENEFVAIDIDTSFANTFDEYVYDRMCAHAFAGNFEYHTGVLGFCLYFTKRYQNTASVELKVKYENYITQVLFFIEKQRIHKILESQQKKNNTFDIYVVLTNTVNFLLLLLQQKTFDSIVNLLLSYYTSLLFEHVIQNDYCKTETILCLWKAGNKLGNEHIKEKTIAIFDENHLDEKSLQLNDIYIRYQSYTYLYQETKKENYSTLRDLYRNKFNEKLKTYQLNNQSVSIWNDITKVGLSLITMENKFPTNWDECLLITT